MATVAQQIQLVYIGLLGRAADKAGLDYWTAEVESGAMTLENLRANIVNEQPEYEAGLGSMTRAQVVSQLYANLFNREADEAGLDYWVGGAGADVNVDQLVLALIDGAAPADRLVLDNKSEAAVYYTDTVGNAYSEADARDAVASVDSTAASVAASRDASDGIAEGAAAGTISLDLKDGAVAGNTWTTANVGKAEWDAAGSPAGLNSADYTFNLSNQLGEGERYNGTFLSPLLNAESRLADSQLFVELLDLRTAGTARPLGDLPVNGFRFTLDGETVLLQSEEIFEAETYNELLAAVRNAIAESDDPRLASFEASLGGQFSTVDSNGNVVSGTTLVLTDTAGGQIAAGNFTYSEDASAGGFTLYGEQSTEAPITIDQRIETNLELDNIGYGSQGGTVNLSGQSNSNVGIELINVTAENGVWLTRLESVNNGNHFLKEIDLQGSGYFHVGAQVGERVQNLEELLASGLGGAGLIDVQDVNGASFEGDIKLNGWITSSVIARDLDAGDTANDPTADNQVFNYTTAAGDDQISLALSAQLMEREDASIVINAGDGNNVVETIIVEDGENPNWLINQQLNANLQVVTGSGDDVVRTWGAGDAVINTGAGNDVIYVDNTGGGSVAAGAFTRDVWEFNSTGTGSTTTGVSNSDVDLSGGANAEGQIFDGTFKLQAQVSFLGFESVWVDVPYSGTSTSALQVNQALKNAINNDPVLQHLLQASDGNGNILDVESLIDSNNLDALSVAFREPLASTDANPTGRPQLTSAEENDGLSGDANLGALENIYAGDSVSNTDIATNAGGSASTVESDNTINAGTGDDVIVLGTGAESNDTVVFEGLFGNNTIVNFVAGDEGTLGFDILDFSSYEVDGLAVGGTNQLGVTTGTDIEFINFVESTTNAGEYNVQLRSIDSDGNNTVAQLLGTVDFGATQAFDADNFSIA